MVEVLEYKTTVALCMVEVIGIQDYGGTVHGRGDWNTRLRWHCAW